MHASIGDRLRVHANHVGEPDQCVRIIEIRGADGAPPYLVQYTDGRSHLVFPGPDTVLDAAEPTSTPTRPAQHDGHARRIHTRTGW